MELQQAFRTIFKCIILTSIRTTEPKSISDLLQEISVPSCGDMFGIESQSWLSEQFALSISVMDDLTGLSFLCKHGIFSVVNRTYSPYPSGFTSNASCRVMVFKYSARGMWHGGRLICKETAMVGAKI